MRLTACVIVELMPVLYCKVTAVVPVGRFKFVPVPRAAALPTTIVPPKRLVLPE